MTPHFTKEFKKAYKKRIATKKNLVKRFKERYDIFVKDPNNSTLRNHPLGGKMKRNRAFSVTGDIRVVYYVHKETAYFIDIGTHYQVYGK